MAEDKIGGISSEAEDKPRGEASISAKMGKSGKPMEHDGGKMPHEHFNDKMSKKLVGDCY